MPNEFVIFLPSGFLLLGSSCRLTASIQTPQATPAGDRLYLKNGIAALVSLSPAHKFKQK